MSPRGCPAFVLFSSSISLNRVTPARDFPVVSPFVFRSGLVRACACVVLSASVYGMRRAIGNWRVSACSSECMRGLDAATGLYKVPSVF